MKRKKILTAHTRLHVQVTLLVAQALLEMKEKATVKNQLQGWENKSQNKPTGFRPHQS
jgi:hypothetical protein